MRLWMLAISLFLAASSSLAQNADIFAAGYSLPAPTPIAPGQVITFFVSGLTPTAEEMSPSERQPGTVSVAANALPLPYKLAGISANLLSGEIAVPIMAVSSSNTCLLSAPAPGLPCGAIIGVTVQVPFELPLDRGFSPPNIIFLTISDDSGHSGAVRVIAETDQIHIVANGALALPSAAGVVTHGDGTMVSNTHQAKPGEELVMYAFGLGITTPTVKAGVASPIPAPATHATFALNVDYGVNISASPGPVLFNPSSGRTPVFTGLTPGYVGLYQINFIVPPPPIGLPACSGPSGGPVVSNLTVTLVGGASFDGAAICVATAP
ncbi:MAG TPA: hypothetical protein VJN43_21815 [Bryobacteraceae bacterium]|nr:hypothetical protein [Bryobacteraceae bacterium]